MWRERVRDQRIRWWHVPAVFLLLVLGHYTRLLQPIENLLTRVIQPAQAAMYAVTHDEILAPNQQEASEELTRQELLDEYGRLEQRLQELLIENTRLRTALEEAQLLKEQIAFLQENHYRFVHARITSVTTENISPTVIVNAGGRVGVIAGLPVVVSDGVFVGIVTDVKDESSEVRLITNLDSRVSAVVQNAVQSPGIVRGEHNLSLVMDFIPQLDQIAITDSVFTNGADAYIPQGLLIGQIQDIHAEPGSLFQQASLKPFFQQNEITIVSILLP